MRGTFIKTHTLLCLPIRGAPTAMRPHFRAWECHEYYSKAKTIDFGWGKSEEKKLWRIKVGSRVKFACFRALTPTRAGVVVLGRYAVLQEIRSLISTVQHTMRGGV